MAYEKPISVDDANFFLAMKATKSTNDKHPDIMAAVTKLAANNTKLGTNITGMESSFEERDENRRGLANELQFSQDELIHQAFIACAYGRSYARGIKDQVLFAVFDRNRSEVERMKDQNIDTVCTEIYNGINANKVQIIGEGLTTEEKIALFKTKLDKFHQLLGDKQSDLSESSAATKRKDKIISDTRLLFEDMDDQVESLKDDYPDYYNEYKASRNIHDLPASHKTSEETPAQPAAPQNPQ